MTPSNLVRIRIKNFMGISNVEIKPNQINQVVGENNQGKTTVLKAIEFIFKGSTEGALVKHGEDQAECFAELPDQTTIRRILKPDGNQKVVVKDANDLPMKAPQSFLDALIDHTGFNPLEVLEPTRRTEAILKAIDLRVTPETIANRIGCKVDEVPNFNFNQHGLKVIDEAYNYYDKRRTEANREALTKHNKWKSYETDFKPQLPPEQSRDLIKSERAKIDERIVAAKVSIGNIETVERANLAIKEKLTKFRSEFESYKSQKDIKVQTLESEIENLAAQLEHKRNELKHIQDLFVQKSEDGQKYYQETEKGLQEVPDKSAYQSELQSCETYTAVLDGAEKEWSAYDSLQQQAKMIQDLENDWKESQERAEFIENQAKQLQHKFKKELMATVEMPLPGLEYADGIFLVNQTPIDQLSSSMAMKLAINIARKLHKKNKVILADGVERLDEKVRAEFFNEIKDDDFTYFFTNVGDGDPNFPTIRMKEGMIQ
jgi:AAA15 family ATPase/GTPase